MRLDETSVLPDPPRRLVARVSAWRGWVRAPAGSRRTPQVPLKRRGEQTDESED